MLIHRILQEAGAERVLNVGVDYELAPIVARSLVATGAAEWVEIAAVDGSPERAVLDGAPENRRRGGR